MPEKTVVVTRTRRPEARLPDLFAEGATLVTYLVERGFFEQVKERLKVDRSSGYTGIDAVLLLLYYFAASSQVGLSRLDELIGDHRGRLAALGDRRRLPTQSSMSRLLGDVEQGDALRAFGTWLLRDATEAEEVLRHPSVVSLDAQGLPWHVFHYDPTKTVLRQRALPEGGDLAPAHRRASAIAAPGYPGHKRGEVVVHRPVLQHAGSSLWLHASLAPGNGDQRLGLRLACAAAAACGDRLGHPRSQLLFVADGEFGYVPSLTEIRAAGMRGITRLNRLDLLEQEDVRRRMATGIWYVVPDSGSGPQRSAMDLGVVSVRPGATTEQDDGRPYDPIDVRVVVSRYPREGKAEHGRVIEGWQYELFSALDLEPEAWPAPDVLTEYFGRGGQENRFAQEDRELDLDRLLSYNLGGQELATLVGLAVWNLRVVLGFRMNPLPAERTPARSRQMEVDTRPFVSKAGDTSEKVTATPPTPLEPDSHPAAPDDQSEAPEDLRPAPPDPASPAESAMTGLRAELSKLDCSRFLQRRPGWSFAVANAALQCPAGQPLRLCGVYTTKGGAQARLLFNATAGVCRECPLRSTCLASVNPDAAKQVVMGIPPSIGAAIADVIGTLHWDRRLRRSQEAHSGPPASGRPRRAVVGEPLPVALPEQDLRVGDWEIGHPQLLPAAARSAFRAACREMVVHVQVSLPASKPVHPYHVTSSAKRQHRRATWAERHARNALPSDAKLAVVFEGAGAISAIVSANEALQRKAS